jgi:hypothetical protein
MPYGQTASQGVSTLSSLVKQLGALSVRFCLRALRTGFESSEKYIQGLNLIESENFSPCKTLETYLVIGKSLVTCQISFRGHTRRHHLTASKVYISTLPLSQISSMLFKHPSKPKLPKVLIQTIRKSLTMGSTSKGSSTFQSTHSNN